MAIPKITPHPRPMAVLIVDHFTYCVPQPATIATKKTTLAWPKPRAWAKKTSTLYQMNVSIEFWTLQGLLKSSKHKQTNMLASKMLVIGRLRLFPKMIVWTKKPSKIRFEIIYKTIFSIIPYKWITVCISQYFDVWSDG